MSFKDIQRKKSFGVASDALAGQVIGSLHPIYLSMKWAFRDLQEMKIFNPMRWSSGSALKTGRRDLRVQFPVVRSFPWFSLKLS